MFVQAEHYCDKSVKAIVGIGIAYLHH